MKTSIFTYIFSAILMIAISIPAFSQGQARGTDQMRDQDRIHQLDRQYQAGDMDRDRDRDRVRDGDKDRYRYRDRDRDNDGMGGKIYGAALMTEQERELYRKRVHNAETEQQRNEIRMQHQKEMRERAKSKGLPAPSE
jgi:hypothetical protein